MELFKIHIHEILKQSIGSSSRGLGAVRMAISKRQGLTQTWVLVAANGQANPAEGILRQLNVAKPSQSFVGSGPKCPTSLTCGFLFWISRKVLETSDCPATVLRLSFETKLRRAASKAPTKLLPPLHSAWVRNGALNVVLTSTSTDG